MIEVQGAPFSFLIYEGQKEHRGPPGASPIGLGAEITNHRGSSLFPTLFTSPLEDVFGGFQLKSE
jgi:hypothetical protein